jgi:SAM-dependent methyltransferase
MEKLAAGFNDDLGVGALIHEGTLYDAQNTFDSDLPFYLSQARRARGPVLELCCGTGRLTVPMARAGIEMTGVDVADSMLAHAKAKARAAGLKIAFHRQDMRRLRLKRRFSLVFIPFNSLQNTYRLSDVEKVFAAVRAHLRPGGRFIVDVFNPSIDYMVSARRLQKRKYRFLSPDGTPVAIDEQCRYDDVHQVNRVTWIYTIGGRRKPPQKLDMRCFYPEELSALLKYNGFRILRRYGDFKGSPFTSGSPKQICVCTRAGERE